MGDDETIDALLRSALAAPQPRLSEGFEAAVMRRTAPRRLTRAGRTALLTYGVASAATCIWLMQDLAPLAILGGLTAGTVATLATWVYTSSLAKGM